METLLDWKRPCRLEELPALLDTIESVSARCGWGMALQTAIMTVVEELVVNVINYGGRQPVDGWFHVRIAGDADGLHVSLHDNGIAFDPFAEVDETEAELDLESRSVGGWGIHFVREMSDTHRYERVDGENHVSLFKKWPAPQ